MAGRGLLIAVRHGRTGWNATGRFQGQSDPRLDQTGVAQAAVASGRVALQLSSRSPNAVRGARAIVASSDLERAAATAARASGPTWACRSSWIAGCARWTSGPGRA